jgi:hypothetical protein
MDEIEITRSLKMLAILFSKHFKICDRGSSARLLMARNIVKDL